VRVASAIFILIWTLARPSTGEGSRSGASTRTTQDRWKIDFKLSLKQRNGKWVYEADGFTNLPPQTVLRARVYVLNVVNDPVRGVREDDDEALVLEDGGIQAAYCRFTAGAGWFHLDVHEFTRQPYSIRYRAKIHYFPGDQTDAITLKVGDEEFTRKADLRAGTEIDYEHELKDRLAEVTRQLTALEKLGLELRNQLDRRPWDDIAWRRWREPACSALDTLRDENRARYALWAVWIEGQSRMRVGALCEFLQHIISAVDEPETRKDGERLRTLLSGYLDSVDEACDVIGADVPLSPLRTLPVLEAYERAVAPLRLPSVPPAVRRRARTDALAALFDLTSLLRVRRRGYAYVNAIAVRLDGLVGLTEVPAGGSRRTAELAGHDQAVREFRSYARLP